MTESDSEADWRAPGRARVKLRAPGLGGRASPSRPDGHWHATVTRDARRPGLRASHGAGARPGADRVSGLRPASAARARVRRPGRAWTVTPESESARGANVKRCLWLPFSPGQAPGGPGPARLTVCDGHD